MDNYAIAICFKNNPSRMVGTFLSNSDGMVRLENAFFEASPGIVFPTIAISEGDITIVKRVLDQPVQGVCKASAVPDSPAAGDEGDVFKTDSQISGEDARRGSTVPKAPEEPKTPVAEGGDWNQFEANSKLFNIDNKFDEEEYMDVLDKSSEEYKSKLSMAIRIEKEIMSSETSDQHRLEERGLGGPAENEDAYSSVLRGDSDGQKAEAGEVAGKPEKGGAGESRQSAGTRKKMVIEIEGLSLSETRKDESQEKANGARGSGAESTLETGSGEEQVPKKSVRYGWMHTKFNSSQCLVEMIGSGFSGVLEADESDLKWGPGPSWEVAAKNMAKKIQKSAKAMASSRKMARKSPVSK